jgi:hypothetical protein
MAGDALHAAIADWRARGGQHFDPVRFCAIEAMARRAAECTGEARRLIDQRLGRWFEAYRAEFAARLPPKPAPEAAGAAAPPAPAMPRRAAAAPAAVPPLPPAPRSPLAQLLAHIDRHAPPAAAPALPGGAAPATEPELKALQVFRDTWSRLSAEQRLTQALDQVPANPGPLNSQHLVHRSLALMRELSPAYLERFVAHVDALMWLEQAAGMGELPATRGRQR